jgi:hypothetical protein
VPKTPNDLLIRTLVHVLFVYIFTRYDNAVEYVGDEIAPLGHSSGYDGCCCRSEHVLEEPHGVMFRLHADTRKVFLAVISTTTATIRQPISDQPVRYGTDDYDIYYKTLK